MTKQRFCHKYQNASNTENTVRNNEFFGAGE